VKEGWADTELEDILISPANSEERAEKLKRVRVTQVGPILFALGALRPGDHIDILLIMAEGEAKEQVRK
jgi:hypothetical protein